MIKKILIALLAVLIAGILYFYLTLYPQLPIANGYAAKKMCSCTFISDRSQESIQDEDLRIGPLAMTKTKLDPIAKSATTTLFGLSPRTAMYREGAGCILMEGADDHHVSLPLKTFLLNDTAVWPLGTVVNEQSEIGDVNIAKLNKAVQAAFDPGYEMDSLKTRAVVVVHKDQIIAEQYAKGFDANTEILGWSMTKSITATMIGILIKNGLLSLDAKHIFPEWSDEREEISLADLLQMQSGLQFDENYGAISDATQMLFTAEDVTSIPKSKALVHPPGTHWNYSSGTTNLLSGLVKDKLGDQEEYLSFPYDSIFYRIGMHQTVIETDESGHYIGSSYCYATPRDWARFGLLYLHQGNWYGDQIVDTSFVDFVRSPASNSGGIYGGQFWLNADHSAYPDVPADLFSCNGFQGQYVFIIPSFDLVVVRMGLAEDPPFNINDFLKGIIESIEIAEKVG